MHRVVNLQIWVKGMQTAIQNKIFRKSPRRQDSLFLLKQNNEIIAKLLKTLARAKPMRLLSDITILVLKNLH